MSEAVRARTLIWSAIFGVLGASSGAMLFTVWERGFSASQVIAIAAGGSLVGAATGALLGALQTRRSRLLLVGLMPPATLLVSTLAIHVAFGRQPGSGGLATATAAGFLLFIVLGCAALAALYFATARLPERVQRLSLVAIAFTFAIVVGLRFRATSGASERDWIALPSTPPAPPSQGEPKPKSATSAAADAGRGTAQTRPAIRTFDTEIVADCLPRKELPALFEAIRAGNSSRVGAVLKDDGVSANLRCEFGEGTSGYPLELAIQEDHLEIARLLLQTGANPNLTGAGGEWPLTLAVQRGATALVRELIAAGADVNAEHNGVSALYEAADTIHVEIARALLEAGANADVSLYGTPAIHLAARGNSAAVLQAFIESGADLNARNATGERPVEAAARAGNAEHVRLLLAAGAMSRTSALRGALVGHQLELARTLAKEMRERGEPAAGCDLLVLSVKSGDVSLVQELLSGQQRIEKKCLARAITEARWRGRKGERVLTFLSSLKD